MTVILIRTIITTATTTTTTTIIIIIIIIINLNPVPINLQPPPPSKNRFFGSTETQVTPASPSTDLAQQFVSTHRNRFTTRAPQEAT